MSDSKPEFSRRELLAFGAYGLTGAAFSSLVSGSANGGAHETHFEPKSKRVIHICLMGGMSHVDSFDYKPGLAKLHGKELQYEERPATFFNRIGLIRKNDWAFKQRGDSGLWVSDLFPHLATVADDLTVIKSMVADSANHTPATFQQNTGFQLNGFLSWGPGFLTGWVLKRKTCPPTSSFQMHADIRQVAPSTGQTVSCRPCIKASLSTAKARPYPTSFLPSPFYPVPTSLAASYLPK